MRNWTLLILTLFVTTLASAQWDQMNNSIEEVVIQENRISLPFKESSRTINVISRKQIEATPARDVADLLQTVAGVDVRQRGVHGVQSDIGIRGGTFDQTLILINGVKMVDPQTGHHSMSLPLSINAIERIEILKGPAARVYGQNGFSGAINIITKKSVENAIEVGAEIGTYDAERLHVTNTYSDKKSSHLIAFNRNTSTGYKHNTDYAVTSFFFQRTMEIADNPLTISASKSWRKFGANGFYASPEFMDQYEEVNTSLLSADYNINAGDWIIRPRISYRRNSDDYVFLRDDPSFSNNLHSSNNYLAEVNTHVTNQLGVFGLGVEFNAMDLESNNLGERSRQLLSFSMEQRFNLLNDRLDITPGIVYSYFSDFENKFFPGIDLGYEITDDFKAYANYGFTYRVPTYTDRFYTDIASEGNEFLQPEEAVAYEVGLKYINRNTTLQASYFLRQGKDLIDWTKQQDTLKWRPINVGEINTSGIDISVNHTVPAGYIIDNVDMSYTFINADASPVDAPFSRYALETLNHQLSAGLSWHVGIINHTVRFRYLDRENLEDYTVLDTRLSLKDDWGSLYLTVSNLFNTEYKETNLVTMPGRWIMGGFVHKFEY